MKDKINYNVLALRGAPFDDMEYVKEYNLDPGVAYTPRINDVMLDITYEQNIQAGTPPEEAAESRKKAARDVKELLAKRGLLKK